MKKCFIISITLILLLMLTACTTEILTTSEDSSASDELELSELDEEGQPSRAVETAYESSSYYIMYDYVVDSDGSNTFRYKYYYSKNPLRLVKISLYDYDYWAGAMTVGKIEFEYTNVGLIEKVTYYDYRNYTYSEMELEYSSTYGYDYADVNSYYTHSVEGSGSTRIITRKANGVAYEKTTITKYRYPADSTSPYDTMITVKHDSLNTSSVNVYKRLYYKDDSNFKHGKLLYESLRLEQTGPSAPELLESYTYSYNISEGRIDKKRVDTGAIVRKYRYWDLYLTKSIRDPLSPYDVLNIFPTTMDHFSGKNYWWYYKYNHFFYDYR